MENADVSSSYGYRILALQNWHFSNANQHLIIENQYFINAEQHIGNAYCILA
jgi:hypothetical protein